MRLTRLAWADIYRDGGSYRAKFETDTGHEYGVHLKRSKMPDADGLHHRWLFAFPGAARPKDWPPIVTGSEDERVLLARLNDFISSVVESSALPPDSDRACSLRRLKELIHYIGCREPCLPTDLVMQYPVSIKGVLLQQGSVVLLENERAELELPGGRLEPWEIPESCLAREMREELRCNVAVGPLLDCWLYEVLPGRRVFIVTYGVERLDAGKLRLSDEHKALVLVPVDQIAEQPLPEGYRRAIERWVAIPK